ncbi:MAG: alpha-amylase family glycosyl hydrolase, partial [Acidimicrobiia bacterium]
MSWWDRAVGYEIYVRSFADSDGDGIGDLPGVESKLEHLESLGVDAIWLTPFYPSPQADFGYDVADYTDVDPSYGTLEDFDRLIAAAHGRGMRLVVDVVPNHTSSQHPWFAAAAENGPGSRYWDYYVWRPPGPEDGAPNNWLSHFGGPAWAMEPRWGMYYLHLFHPKQPDLNWENPNVHQEFKRILRFWVERGVDGFRIDVAHALYKHPSFANNPRHPEVGDSADPLTFRDFAHVHDLDQPDNVEVYKGWKIVVGPELLLLGEVYLYPPHLVRRYVGDGALDISFYLGLNQIEWDPEEFVERIRHAAETIPSGWAWVQGSHDEHRNVTRYGGGPEGLERSLALWVALMGLPGIPFLYQGEELGLPNGVVHPHHVLDPAAAVSADWGRDPCRTPMPWTTLPGHGFTEADTAWLVAEPRPEEETVELQRRHGDSPLNRMRELIAVRRETDGARAGEIRWIAAKAGVLAYAREAVA